MEDRITHRRRFDLQDAISPKSSTLSKPFSLVSRRSTGFLRRIRGDEKRREIIELRRIRGGG